MFYSVFYFYLFRSSAHLASLLSRYKFVSQQAVYVESNYDHVMCVDDLEKKLVE